MNACTIACIALNEYHSVSHAVAGSVTAVAVNGNGSVVHGITRCVLSVAVNGDIGLGKVCAQSVAGNAVYLNILADTAASDKSLTQAVFYNNVLVLGQPYFLIKKSVMQISRSNLSHFRNLLQAFHFFSSLRMP